MKRSVAIIQTRLTHYRVPLFEGLKTSLQGYNVELKLICSESSFDGKERKDEGYLDWSTIVAAKHLQLGGVELFWQSALKHIADSDLIIVPQENRLVLNYLLFIRKFFVNKKLAFWGHGKNMQAENTNWFKDQWKSLFLTLPDWWFGYTNITKNILLNAGFPESKITVVQNAIDNVELKMHASQVKPSEIEELKRALGISGGSVGIFCGSIYAGKRMNMCLDIVKRIKACVNDFEFVIIGSGPEQKLAADAAKENKWIHYVGPKHGYEKALHLKLGKFLLLPYSTGLAILDSFILGIPAVIMDNGSHGPERAYLENNINGIIAKDVNALIGSVADLLSDPLKMKAMSEQCLTCGDCYTIEKMINNFSSGILSCLAPQP